MVRKYGHGCMPVFQDFQSVQPEPKGALRDYILLFGEVANLPFTVRRILLVILSGTTSPSSPLYKVPVCAMFSPFVDVFY